MPDSVRSRTSYLAEDVEKTLRNSIENGDYVIGAKLPTENQLGEQFGVSRTVVREAIAGLRAAGLIVSRRGSGVFVRSQCSEFPAETLFDGDWPKRVPEVIDMLELRAAVEIQGAMLAATRASIRQLEEIHEAHRVFVMRIQSGQEASAEDYAFHQAIARATNNACFEDYLSQMGGRTIPRSNLSVAHDSDAYSEYMAQLEIEHERILAALEARDPDASAAAMRCHLMGSLHRYRRLSRDPQN